MEIKEVNNDMNIVSQMYSDFCKCAQTIPGFILGQKEDVDYDITELANCYVEAMDKGDQEGMNKYISALMVRYWHMVPYLYNESKSARLDMEDMVMWIYEGFAKAFKYRSWLDPNKEVSKDPKGAEKCFNQCITSVRQYWYRHFNKDKRKINYTATSLDAMLESLKDSFDDGMPQEELYDSSDTCREIISSLVKEGKIFDAIVIDKICFDDTFKEIKNKKQMRIVNDEGEFLEDISTSNYILDNKKLVSCLKSIDQKYIMEFSETYDVSPQTIILVINQYTKKNVGNNVQGVLNRVRNNKKVLSLLC